MASPPLALAESPLPKSPAVSVTRRNRHCWSELPLDLMQSVFKRLGFADFERAKSVCSSWQSGTRQSQPNNQIPWMILFPEDKSYCLLFNPEDKEKVYKTQHLGDDFAKSECCKTYRSWLLMVTHNGRDRGSGSDVYMLNIFTHERINLPTCNQLFFMPRILWIDEETKDYLVIGIVDDEKVLSIKKGDDSWKEILLFPGIERRPMPIEEEIPQLVYKDDKLYCLNFNQVHIFDFSGVAPLLVFSTCVKECVKRLLVYPRWIPKYGDLQRRNNMVVTLGGDILIVRRKMLLRRSFTWNFKIFKMDSSDGNKWKEIFTLGDEAILLDLGITVLAKDLEGITSNSIYYNDEPDENLHYNDNVLVIYNVDTKKIEQPQEFVSSSDPFSYACWFLPSFKRG
uniref:F-box protein n=2 Tax=Noccaea caerulescens TaxID=107243 RepID=A0A1J3HEU4_NOCCA